MTLHDLDSALRQAIQRRYPHVPVQTFHGGLLSPESLDFWRRSGASVEQILRETMGPARVRES